MNQKSITPLRPLLLYKMFTKNNANNILVYKVKIPLHIHRQRKSRRKVKEKLKCAEINNLEEKIKIHINERNQPIGPNSMKLSSLLGVSVREMVPIAYFDQRKVLDQLKEDLWNIINVSIRHYVYLFSTFLFLDDFKVYFQTMYGI